MRHDGTDEFQKCGLPCSIGLLTDADLGPKVMKQLHFLPKRIKGRDDVARIVKRFMEKKSSND